ncbi:MAG: hypothetical protein ABEK00_01520 [Candidatus Nanohaloarchaea archaeon]
MNLAYFAAGVFVGIVLGLGGAIFYLRWRMKRQLGMMEDQMSDLMESTQDLTEGLGEVEEVENKEENE